MEAEPLAELLVSLWNFTNLANGVRETRLMLLNLLEHSIISNKRAAVLTHLCDSPVIDVEIKQKIIENLVSQVQFRRSGLKDPDRKAELATEWLFEGVREA